jgi:uncharacterized protein (DUF169 family)
MTSYAEISRLFQETLDLDGSPVAVKTVTSPDQIPENMQEIGETVRHCRMVSLARHGEVFYATEECQQCKGGAWSLGLREQGESLKTGEHYFKLGRFGSIGASRRTVAQVPALPQDNVAVLYAPLEKAEFVPDAVIIFAKPAAMLKFAQTVLFRLGGRLYPEFSGIQSVCADATAYVILSGKANFSLGCDGSRKFSGISDEEMVAGFPEEILPELAAGMLTVVNAYGSKK